MLQSLFFCKRVRFKTVFLEITILSITLALNARHMHEAYLMGTPIAIQSQETVRIAIRGCGEVLLSIRVWRGVGSMVRCGNIHAQTTTTGGSIIRGSYKVVSCKKDSQCPAGQRCGFTSGCKSKGKCVVPSGKASCIDPGGFFCGVSSSTEFTSAPVDAVGPCPRPCTKELGCGSRLVCQNGFCIKP
jgi:hypothetical protein